MPFGKILISLTLLLACSIPEAVSAEAYKHAGPIPAAKVNLALRRTADKLLRLSGDSTSRIAPVEQTSDSTWRLQLSQTFRYDTLPHLLQAALDQYGIKQPYTVAVRQCEDDIIALGYHQEDFRQDSVVPCLGRELPQACLYIEITFAGMTPKRNFTSATGLLLALVLVAGGIWWWRRKYSQGSVSPAEDSGWIAFGKSRLDAKGLMLDSNGTRQSLTYREAKLLRLFAEHPDQLLERDVILQQVWADEGVQVGRSVDMFVSRLRKKLQPDPTLGIVAVHGVGYRLEVKTA